MSTNDFYSMLRDPEQVPFQPELHVDDSDQYNFDPRFYRHAMVVPRYWVVFKSKRNGRLRQIDKSEHLDSIQAALSTTLEWAQTKCSDGFDVVELHMRYRIQPRNMVTREDGSSHFIYVVCNEPIFTDHPSVKNPIVAIRHGIQHCLPDEGEQGSGDKPGLN